MKPTLKLLSIAFSLAVGLPPSYADKPESVAVVVEPHLVVLVRPAPASTEAQQVALALVRHTNAVRAAERHPNSRRARCRRDDASDVFDALLEYYDIINDPSEGAPPPTTSP